MEKKRIDLMKESRESDKQFLNRTGMTGQMQDVLSKIIQNRPQDPIVFLASYFETVGDKTDRVLKAHQQVCLTHHSKPAFHTNVRAAYHLLSETKVSKRMKGINGKVYSDLLKSLCNSFPVAVQEKLMMKIQCRSHEAVSFEVFKSGVFTCLVLQDFLKQSEELFESLDSDRSGKIDSVLCEIIIQHLVRAVSNTNTAEPASVLQGGYVLGPDTLHTSMAKALFNSKGSGHKAVMTSEDFISGAAEAFLSKVQALK